MCTNSMVRQVPLVQNAFMTTSENLDPSGALSRLNLTQTVMWGDGSARLRTGTVIEVVPAGKLPARHYQARKAENARRDVSYVIQVGFRTQWPRTGTRFSKVEPS